MRSEGGRIVEVLSSATLALYRLADFVNSSQVENKVSLLSHCFIAELADVLQKYRHRYSRQMVYKCAFILKQKLAHKLKLLTAMHTTQKKVKSTLPVPSCLLKLV